MLFRSPTLIKNNEITILGNHLYVNASTHDWLLVWQALFTTLGFNFPLTVAFLQMGIICPVCYLVARPKVTYDLAHVMAPLALVNVFNVVCGLVSESISFP